MRWLTLRCSSTSAACQPSHNSAEASGTTISAISVSSVTLNGTERVVAGLSWLLLGLESIAASIGDQDRRVGRILLDLLAQAIDVRLERVGGDAGVVAPDLVQQHVTRHRPVAGAEQIHQDGGFLVGQPDLLLAALLHQHLAGGMEFVGADGHHRILAALVLAQMRAEPR